MKLMHPLESSFSSHSLLFSEMKSISDKPQHTLKSGFAKANDLESVAGDSCRVDTKWDVSRRAWMRRVSFMQAKALRFIS